MSESELEIYTILTNDLKKKIQENLEQVKILWTRQTNLISITLTNSISDKYWDFMKLFAEEALEETLLTH